MYIYLSINSHHTKEKKTKQNFFKFSLTNIKKKWSSTNKNVVM